ncbi:hypothetical protein LTR17_023647 [Elasticomyces elasticus]|nr:hypothetical protein LTR17_023647 [Elasticomyces elasticus]
MRTSGGTEQSQVQVYHAILHIGPITATAGSNILSGGGLYSLNAGVNLFANVVDPLGLYGGAVLQIPVVQVLPVTSTLIIANLLGGGSVATPTATAGGLLDPVVSVVTDLLGGELVATPTTTAGGLLDPMVSVVTDLLGGGGPVTTAGPLAPVISLVTQIPTLPASTVTLDPVDRQRFWSDIDRGPSYGTFMNA